MVMPKIRVTREDLSKLQLYKDHMKLVQADVDGASGDQRHAIYAHMNEIESAARAGLIDRLVDAVQDDSDNRATLS